MTTWKKILPYAYWGLVGALFAAMVAVVIFYTPTEATMGPVQKIFYIHLPSAINTFLACLVVFVASIGYLWQRKTWWDDFASAAAKVAVLLSTIVLVTGMIWARGAWNVWWAWTPRLTFSLVLWLLYVVYLTLRTSIESSERRAIISAVYGIVAFLDVPLVYLSVRLMSDPLHPVSVELAPEMKLTLALGFIPVTLMSVGLIAATYGLNRRIRALGEQEQRWTPKPVRTRALKEAV